MNREPPIDSENSEAPENREARMNDAPLSKTSAETAAPPAPGRILARTADGVGHIVFDNAPRRNAMSLAMWRQLAAAMRIFAKDPATRVIVLEGAGDEAFVSGADISEFERIRADARSAAEYEAVSDAAFSALETSPKPVVAKIHGFCFGGGLAIAMKADLRIARSDALFSIPAARLGIAYPPASVRDLTSLVGPARAKDILFTARRLEAEEAAAIGLVNEVASAAGFAARIAELTATLIDNAPLSIAAAKAGIDHFSRGLADENDAWVARCFDSADYAEGRRAFMDKRRPIFSGK